MKKIKAKPCLELSLTPRHTEGADGATSPLPWRKRKETKNKDFMKQETLTHLKIPSQTTKGKKTSTCV